MTLFQLVTINSPVKLTRKGNRALELVKENFTQSPSFIQNFIREGLEGLEIGLALAKSDSNEFFEELVDKELN